MLAGLKREPAALPHAADKMVAQNLDSAEVYLLIAFDTLTKQKSSCLPSC